MLCCVSVTGRGLLSSCTERGYPLVTVAGLLTAMSLQSCPTLCDPIDRSPPGSPIPGILQARTLEWVAISCTNAWKWKVKVKSLSHVGLFSTPWTAAYQAPPSIGFSKQEYWSGVPLPSLVSSNSFSISNIIQQFKLSNLGLWISTSLFFIIPLGHLIIMSQKWVYIHIYIHTHTHTQASDRVQEGL